jgi:hypothetical protein
MKMMYRMSALATIVILAGLSIPAFLHAEDQGKGEEIVVPAIQSTESDAAVVVEHQEGNDAATTKKAISSNVMGGGSNANVLVTVSTAAPIKGTSAPPSEKAKAFLDLEDEKIQAPAESPPVAQAKDCSPKKYRVYNYMPDSLRSQGTDTLLSDMSKDVAGKVFYQLKDDGEKNYTSKVAVVAAVPLSDLKRETEFGRVMAEFLLTDLADRGLKVKELRLGKEINILAQTGEFILSRNIGELANISPELDYVVVSTFTNTRKMLIVQGRLVDLKNGLVKTSWRHTMPLNRELLGLFHTIEKPYTIAVKGMIN